MALTLGRRIGLLAPVLEIPDTAWTLQAVADKLNELGERVLGNLTAQVLSKIFNGVEADRLAKGGAPQAKIIRTVTAILDTVDRFWEDHQTTSKEMATKLAASDAEFLRYLAGDRDEAGANGEAESTRPALPATRDEPDGPPQLVGVLKPDMLLARLLAKRHYLLEDGEQEKVFFLYRLGFNAGNGFVWDHDKLRLGSLTKPSKAKKKGSGVTFKNGLVIRRIPVRIRHDNPDQDHFIYEEHYEEAEGDKPFISLASAYVFQDFLTIIAKDRRGRDFIEVSHAQIDLEQGLGDPDDIFPGIISMRSDCGKERRRWNPTSYRLLLRPARHNSSKEKIAWPPPSELSRTIPALDMDGNGKITASDFDPFEDAFDDAQSWMAYFNRLNVIEAPADLLVVHATEYTNGPRSARCGP